MLIPVMKAIQIQSTGGPEVLQLVDLPIPEPGPGQVLIRVEATGVNFIEIYFRKGVYKTAFPLIPGSEAAGTVEELGPGVNGFKAGEAVASTAVIGSYAEYALVPAAQLVKIPAGLSMESAAAVMLQGMTAHYLTRSTYPLKAGETSWSMPAREASGCCLRRWRRDSALGQSRRFQRRPKRSCRARPAPPTSSSTPSRILRPRSSALPVARASMWCIDSVGKTTFDKSLNCLRPRGLMALFGASSGPVPPFDPTLLNSKGSLFLTRPTLWHYIATRTELEWRAGDVLGWVASGELKLRTEYTYPLAEAAQAQIDLEARKTTGKILLVP